MAFALFVTAIVVGAGDPILWIAPIIAAFFSRGRKWVVLLVALCWGGVLEIARTQMIFDYHGERIGFHLASALLAGLVVLGIAAVIRKMRGERPVAPE
jgi:hypothetical protein